MMLKFMEKKPDEPKLTQKQLSKLLGFLDLTVKR